MVDVPQDELFIEEGPPVFPVANANRRALVEGAAEGELPDIPLKEVPFPPEGSDAKPPLRDPKVRSVYMGGCQNYVPFLGTLNNRCRIIIGTQKGTIILTTTHITVERIIKFKETPGCKACYGKAAVHTPECRKRFYGTC